VTYGIDTFDSCYPTRAARHSVVLIGDERIKLQSGKFREDFAPIDATCPCWTCRHYSRAYIHHLFKAHEPTALTLATIHNIQAMMRKMASLREKILRDEI
jgi:queuine tRNA-ribosyltransferase